MIVFRNLMQLLNLASVANRTRQVAPYGSVSMLDDIFTASHRNRCRSSLRPIQPGIAHLRPAWKINGKTEKVQNVKMAAVLVPLCFVNKVPSILLTVRSSQLLGYKGEVRYIVTKQSLLAIHITGASPLLSARSHVSSHHVEKSLYQRNNIKIHKIALLLDWK